LAQGAGAGLAFASHPALCGQDAAAAVDQDLDIAVGPDLSSVPPRWGRLNALPPGVWTTTTLLGLTMGFDGGVTRTNSYAVHEGALRSRQLGIAAEPFAVS